MAHEPVYCLHGASTQAKVSRVSQDPAKALAVPVGGSVIPLPLRAGRPSEIRIGFASTGSRAYSLLEPLSKGRIVYRKFRIAADRRTQPAAFVAGGEGEGGQGVPELIIAIRRKAFTTEAQRARRKIRSKKSPGLRGELSLIGFAARRPALPAPSRSARTTARLRRRAACAPATGIRRGATSSTCRVPQLGRFCWVPQSSRVCLSGSFPRGRSPLARTTATPRSPLLRPPI